MRLGLQTDANLLFMAGVQTDGEPDAGLDPELGPQPDPELDPLFILMLLPYSISETSVSC